MTPEELLAHCLAKPGAWPDQPWEDEWLMRYPGDASVMPYLGRSGWNTLRIGGAIPDDEIREAVDASYDRAVARLPKKYRP